MNKDSKNTLDKNTNIMVDLETLDLYAGGVILSIGAVEFDSHSIKDTFYRTIRIDEQLNNGFTVNSSVLQFWMDQNDEARKEAFKGEDYLLDVLNDFASWCNIKDDIIIWGNSARFDLSILEAAYKKMEYFHLPWDARNGERCYKTIKKIYPDITLERIGELHNALDDANSQAQHLISIFKQIDKNNK